MKTIAKLLSNSFLCEKARKLWQCNKRDWNYPLSKWQKLMVGLYLIVRDYAEGNFPPCYDDEQATFNSEIAYSRTLQTLGVPEDEFELVDMRKPFWHGPKSRKYLRDYVDIVSFFHNCGITPPARLLEVGCGSGWVAEFLASSGFRVCATTLDATAGEKIELRKKSLEAKGLPTDLQFRPSPMEYVHDAVEDLPPFDVVYVYEALHHAHNWRRAISAFYDCVGTEGWCFILSEPNVLHTLISYRVGRLSNTHEIGLSQLELRNELKQVGFQRIKAWKSRFHWWTKPIWIAAQK